MQALRERRNIASIIFTTTLDRGEQSASRAAALYPGERPPVPIVQEAGWASELVWTQRIEEKSFAFVTRLCVTRGISLLMLLPCEHVSY
jgi:hypothetical protein